MSGKNNHKKLSKKSYGNCINIVEITTCCFYYIFLGYYKIKMDLIVYKLNRILNKWLRDNGFDCYVMYSDSFGYDYLNGVINYTLYDETYEDELFLTICKSIYDTDYDDFIISFLHELGHHVTRKFMTLKDIDELAYMQETFCDDSELLLHHMVSFIEWEATSWACNFVENNKEAVEELYKLTELSRVDFFNYMMYESNEE